MSTLLEKTRETLGQGVSDLFTHLTAAATLTPADLFNYASTVSGTGAFTLTLPPPELMPGVEICIFMVARNSTDDITVTAGSLFNRATGSFADIVLNLANEFTVVKSIGKNWVETAYNHS